MDKEATPNNAESLGLSTTPETEETITPQGPEQSQGIISPTIEKPKSKKTTIILVAIAVVVALAVTACFLLASRQPSTTHNKSSTNHSSEPSDEQSDQESDTEEEAVSESTDEYNTQEQQQPSAEKYTKDTLIGTLECTGTNSLTTVCNIPNEKVINAKEELRYSLTEFTDQQTAHDPFFNTNIGVSINENNPQQATVLFPNPTIFLTGASTLEKSYTFAFENNIIKVRLSGFGHAAGDECLFFILENGELWYSKLSELAGGNHEAKQVAGVSDVITVLTGGVNARVSIAGGADTYAIRSDGQVYRLGEILLPFDD